MENSALQRHWTVKICKQVFMLIFLLLVEYLVWLFALRTAVTQSTVCEKKIPLGVKACQQINQRLA